MKQLLTLEDVNWTRNGQKILSDINWQVSEGEQWAILGLNGSGKTSILNIVTGYTYPTSGKVNVLGTQFGQASIPKMREKIGFMSSSLERFGSTFNKQTVKNIILSGKYSSVGVYSNQTYTDTDQALAESLLEDLGISNLQDKAYAYLSQGEKRKALIGRSLMNQPKLLILDEPCSGLDLQAREDVLELIDTIAARRCHLLYVTHYIEEITDSITHVALIQDGSILAKGPKRDILTDELLSQTFKIPLKVRWEHQRPWITIQPKL